MKNRFVRFACQPSHDNAHARHQFTGAKRLGQVVVRTRIESRDLILFRLTADAPYEVPSNRGFYLGYTLLDGLLLLLIVSIFWQAFRLNSWAIQYKNTSRSKQIAAWLVIIFDLLICAAILMLPKSANSSWSVMLFHRPDFSIPLLVISISLGLLGLVKVIKTRTGNRKTLEYHENFLHKP